MQKIWWGICINSRNYCMNILHKIYIFGSILLIADARNRSFLLDVSRLKKPRKEAHLIKYSKLLWHQCSALMCYMPFPRKQYLIFNNKCLIKKPTAERLCNKSKKHNVYLKYRCRIILGIMVCTQWTNQKISIRK